MCIYIDKKIKKNNKFELKNGKMIFKYIKFNFLLFNEDIIKHVIFNVFIQFNLTIFKEL